MNVFAYDFEEDPCDLHDNDTNDTDDYVAIHIHFSYVSIDLNVLCKLSHTLNRDDSLIVDVDSRIHANTILKQIIIH